MNDYKFGAEIAPDWFLRLVEAGKVQYLADKRVIKCCKVKNTVYKIGDVIPHEEGVRL